ncbi:histidine kinase [Niabella sp. CC-SYL272]|uniref:tetratricopeptide repeat-containing sensor histidine kinase n=1 Tax=Niabella agricola TaxID=2891571 RepID=UPI001F36F398|nr:ATP-binding protein [Niabella agricola]MCF3107579.1 histidine kinase [Niabella agricola]
MTCLQVDAQINKDSLRHNIRLASTDSLRIQALYAYMKATLNDNTSDFEPYLREMVRLSKKTVSKWGLSTAYILSLSYYKNIGNYETALRYGDSAAALLSRDTASGLLLNRGHLYNNRGNLYYSIGDFRKALDDYFQAERIFKQQRFKTIASVYSSIANCFTELSNDQKATEFSDRAVEAAMQFDDPRLLATCLMNKATMLMNIDRYAAADSILSIVWPVVQQLRNTKSLFVYYLNKGDVTAYYQKDSLKALTYYKQSYAYASENHDVSQIAKALVSLAQLKTDMKQADAVTYIDSLYRLADENGMSSLKADALGLYAQWNAQRGDYKKAYAYEREQKALSDSLNSEESRQKISMLEVRFRIENKEQEIAKLKTQDTINRLSIRQKSTLNSILIGGSIGLVIILALLYRNYRNRQKLQLQRITELETEKQLTATEAVLKGEEQERTRLAKDLHDGLGGMLSGMKHAFQAMKEHLIMTPENQLAFERSMDMLDCSIKEMRRVAHNMMPESLVKFGLDTALRDFCNGIQQSGALHLVYQSIGMEQAPAGQTTAVAVYRIVQELIHNVLKHAAASNALVQLSYAEGALSVTVEDNGRGMDIVQRLHAGGMGWQNIQNRVDFLKGTLDIQSQPGRGLSVFIEIPAENQ